MQPQMQQNNPQGNPQDSTAKANNAAASLAFATHLQTQMMQHQQPTVAPQEAQNAPGEENMKPEEHDEPKVDVAKELTSFKTEIEGMIKSQIGDLKREIQTALSEDKTEDNGQQN